MKAGRKYALRLEYFDNASSAEVSFGYMTPIPAPRMPGSSGPTP